MIYGTFTIGIASALLLFVQQPAVENGPVETRAGANIDAEVRAVGPDGAPVWLAWRVPMVAGERDLCATWSDGQTSTRGLPLEDGPRTAIGANAAPANRLALEAGTSLIVLLRVVEGAVERLRFTTDTCPLDAGGRRVVWLSNVTPAGSLQYLDTLITLATPASRNRTGAAVGALALHDGRAAEEWLIRQVTSGRDAATRDQAASWLARTRGRVALPLVSRLIKEERDAARRRQLVTVLAQTGEPDALPLLLELAASDQDTGVRTQATRLYARMAPADNLDAITARLSSETNAAVQAAAVAGLASRGEAAVPLLLDLARSAPHPHVRREAVRALSRSTDRRAIAYLEELVAR